MNEYTIVTWAQSLGGGNEVYVLDPMGGACPVSRSPARVLTELGAEGWLVDTCTSASRADGSREVVWTLQRFVPDEGGTP